MPEEATGALIAALAFAAQRHQDQRRKGESHEPYVNHPIRVLQILWEIGGVRDVTTLVAALLHDTVEDTDTTLEELRSRFGPEVASVVNEVTDDKSLPKAVRKQLQIDHAPQASERAKLVKLADKICNVHDISHTPPAGWSHARIEDYLSWADKVVAGLRGVNPALEAGYDATLAQVKRKLAAMTESHQ